MIGDKKIQGLQLSVSLASLMTGRTQNTPSM